MNVLVLLVAYYLAYHTRAYSQGHPTNTNYFHKAKTLKLTVHINGYIKGIPPTPVISIKLGH